MEKEYIDRIVVKPSVARKLLQEGYHIIDIRPRVFDGVKDFGKCVFLFEGAPKLNERITELIKKSL